MEIEGKHEMCCECATFLEVGVDRQWGRVLQNTLSSTGLSRGISFFLLLDTTEPSCHITSPPASLSPTSSGLLPGHYPHRRAYSRAITRRISRCVMFPFFLPLLPMLSSFFLASLLVVLGVPPCQFCASTVEHLVVALCRQSHWTSNYSGT